MCSAWSAGMSRSSQIADALDAAHSDRSGKSELLCLPVESVDVLGAGVAKQKW